MAPGGSKLRALGGWEGSEGRGADWAVQKRRGPLIGSPSAWFAAPRVAAVSEAARYLAPLLHDKFSPVHLTAIVLRAPRARFAWGGTGRRRGLPCARLQLWEESPRVGWLCFLVAARCPGRWFVGCKGTVPAVGAGLSLIPKCGCSQPGAMLLLGISILALAWRPAGSSEPEWEVVVPIRRDPDINGRHYYRRGTEDSGDQGLIFQITAFQQDFYLHLTPDTQFLAPAFATEYLGVPLQRLTGSSLDLRRCFYSGYVNAEPDSFAAVSLCGGLRGAFGYRGAEYVISPLPNASAPAAQRHSQGAHLLQRRGAPVGPSGDPTSRCGVASGWNPAILRALDPYKPRRTGVGESHSRLRSGRAKRFVSIPRYVETLVVADESMVKFHGADLEHYLLTLLATAARLYRHPSILNPINIVVVKVLLLGDRDTGPKVTGNAALTLRNFCAWQKKLNKVSDKHPEYWDTAILFTRQVSWSVTS